MLECSGARLFAQNNGCNECANIANNVLANPFSAHVTEKNIRASCSQSCNNKASVDMVAQKCGNIKKPHDFLPKSECSDNTLIYDHNQVNQCETCKNRCGECCTGTQLQNCHAGCKLNLIACT